MLDFRKLDSALDDYDLLIFDLWGVLIEGMNPYVGAIDAINKIQKKKKIVFLSNSPRPAPIVKTRLISWGVDSVEEDMIITAGDVACDLINSHCKSLKITQPTIFHLGKANNQDILSRLPHKNTEELDNADVALLSIYTDNHDDVESAREFLKQLAAYRDLLTICANPDTIVPLNGSERYCAGYFAEIIEEFGGKVVYSGKPKPEIYSYVLNSKHAVDHNGNKIPKDRILMIGDTLETDILGANNVGIHSALVLSGNAQRLHHMNPDLNEKLKILEEHGQNIGAVPNLITSLV